MISEEMKMRIDDELKILAVKTGMTLTEMGRRMDKSPQALLRWQLDAVLSVLSYFLMESALRSEEENDPIYRRRYV